MRDLAKSKKIHARAVACAKNYLHHERKMLEDLIDVERDKTYEIFGIARLTPYCMKKLGLSKDVAQCFVRIVNKSKLVPELAESVIKGEVSLYKARAIASTITTENKDEWLKKAQSLCKEKLEFAVAEFQGREKQKIALSFTHEAVEKLKRAREIHSSKAKEYSSLEDTIETMTDEYLYKHDPIEKAQRSRDHSNAYHQVTLRDEECCQFIHEDGTQCADRMWLHKHHIIYKSKGGPDTVENLITLCSSHHRMVHKH